MAQDERAEDGAQPRRLLLVPAEFGRDPAAAWHPIGPGQSLPEVISAYWQHLVVCSLRERYPVRMVDELTDRLGKANAVYVRRQVAGEYRVPLEELLGWVVAFDDISLLPQPGGITDLYPPGARPG